MNPWTPRVHGIVNSIAFRSGKCGDAYIGGSFNEVNGTRVGNIAEISTRTGNVVPQFAHNVSGPVDTLLAANGRILVGGHYSSINGSSANPFMTGLNATTGKDDNFLHLRIHGSYQYPGVAPNPTEVYNQALSHGGEYDLVMGDFTSVGGLSRQQAFMLPAPRRPLREGHGLDLETKQGHSPPTKKKKKKKEEPYYVRAGSNGRPTTTRSTSPRPETTRTGLRQQDPEDRAMRNVQWHSQRPTPPSSASGSTTRAATRCTARRPIAARPTLPATSAGR